MKIVESSVVRIFALWHLLLSTWKLSSRAAWICRLKISDPLSQKLSDPLIHPTLTILGTPEIRRTMQYPDISEKSETTYQLAEKSTE
jgi:hypothetical protein